MHSTRDTCFPGRGTHITRDMCFSGRGTHITKDMCFSGRGTELLVVFVGLLVWILPMFFFFEC